MGSWGGGAYQNDDAVNWLCELESFFMKAIEGGTVGERIAAIQTVSLLRIEPCFEDLKTCPLGFRLPGYELIDCILKSVRDLLKREDLEDEQVELLEVFKGKFEYLMNQCILMDKRDLVRASLILPE